MQHFDLCVIGSGSGNSLISKQFADWNVALIDESAVFGGTCLNRGCIPTKMFVVPADLAESAEQAARLGVTLGPAKVDWPGIRDRIFARIDPLSAAGLAWRQEARNVTVFQEHATFVDEHVLQVGDQQISADQIVIAAGSRPRTLDVAGMEDPNIAARVHTSDSIMRLETLPRSLVIIGGGYIAVEFAHIFSSFGTRVTLIQHSDRLLRREDHEVSNRFTELIERKVVLHLNQRLIGLEPGDDGEVVVVTADRNDMDYTYEAEQVLVAVGRIPNGDRLNLDAAGLSLDSSGLIRVDAHQRTGVSHIWALGDVSNKSALKHVANHEMRVVQHNLLNPDSLIESNRRFVPHAIFSSPQIASVGVTEQELSGWGRPYVKSMQDYSSVAYGWALEDEGHFVKLLADETGRHLLGAHIIGPQAATLIQPLIQAMSSGLDVESMARGQYWIHPALTEVVENALLGLLSAARHTDTD